MKHQKKEPKILYDKESNVLSIEVQRVRSVDSDISKNVVIDYDRNGEIVRVNLYNFSFEAFEQGKKSVEKFLHNNRVLAK